MRRFDQDVNAPGIAFKEATRETPDYLTQTLAIIPLSIGVGLVVLIGAALICWGFQKPASAALVLGGLVMSLCALFAFWRVWEDRLYMALETITGHDLDGDGHIGVPQQVEGDWRIILENENDGHQAWLQFDTPELRRKAKLAAKLTLNGTPFSENSMCGKNRPLSRSEFMTLRDLYLFHSLLTWKDQEHRTLGTQWTAAGRSYVRKLASEGTTPPRMSTQGSPKVLQEGTVGEWDD